MYADTITPSMQQAIDETNRRREKQLAFNAENGIDPTPLRKKIADITDLIARESDDTEALLGGSGRRQSRGKPAKGAVAPVGLAKARAESMPSAELAALIQELTEQMQAAAAELQFEVAARLRDEVADLKKELRGMQTAGV